MVISITYGVDDHYQPHIYTCILTSLSYSILHTAQPYPQQTPYPSGHTAMPTPGNYSGYRPPPTTGAQPPYPTTCKPVLEKRVGEIYSYDHTCTHTDQQYPGYPSSTQPSHHQPNPASSIHTPATITTAAVLGTAAASISAEEEERHFKESERIKRQSLETAVEDKIRRQVKQVLDSAQVWF